MELSNLDETRARKYRKAAVAFLVLTAVSLLGVFVGLYYSSPFITLYSLMLTGIFFISAFFSGGVGLSVVARQGARTVYRREERGLPAENRNHATRLERSEQQEGARLDTEPPYMTDFPEEDHPPERGR